VAVEDAAFRRSRLVNGKPKAAVLMRITHRVHLNAGTRRALAFLLPQRYVRATRGRATRLRFTAFDAAGASVLQDDIVTPQRS
jgi:hypothetical protein